jgi:SAM-dependent methyltransferase
MGMLMYDALVLGRTAKEVAHRGRCLMLGVPTLNFKPEHFFHQWNTHPDLKDFPLEPVEFETPYDFFRMLGFEAVHALDISDYEGADIIADLNDPALPETLGQTFDLIYDSGTTEHIFDAPTALRSLARLISPGGAIVHATPSNGFLDHGFWQISPDLYRTFYTKAGFGVLSSSLFVFADEPYALPAEINLYRTHGRKYVSGMAPEAIAVFAALKERDGDLGPISLQEYYSLMHEEVGMKSTARFFLTFGNAPADPTRQPAQGQTTKTNVFTRAWSKIARLVG